MTYPQRVALIELLDPNHPLKLPVFQRSFAWGEKEIGDYWRDQVAALDVKSGPVDYFMGLVVVDQDRRIQDGQQRLATTLIFVQELWQLAREITKTETTYQDSLFNDLAAVLAPLNSSKPVLEISEADQMALLQKAGIAATLPESARRLVFAREQLRKALEDDLGIRQVNAKLSRLLSWAQFLESHAYVVELEVPAQVAHTIFETLNTRGVRLSNGDLVKSYLLARASNISTAQNLWASIIESLEDDDGDYEANLEDFLYHYYGSMYGKGVSIEKLFEKFTEMVENEDPIDVLENLKDSAALYAGLIAPLTAPSVAQHTEDARHAIHFINGMTFRQLRFLLLAVLRDYQAGLSDAARRQQQSELVEKIAAWSIRSLVTGRVGGQTAQSVYVSAAKAIRDGQATTVNDVRKLFLAKKLFIRTNQSFVDALKQWRVADAQARAILTELERVELGTSAALQLKGGLTLEHVLPKNPKAGTWKQFTTDDRVIYPYRLGNYLLLAQPFNSTLGNLEWPDKRTKIDAVKGSQTPLTVAALAYPSWGKTTIKARDKLLGGKAAAHWKA